MEPALKRRRHSSGDIANIVDTEELHNLGGETECEEGAKSFAHSVCGMLELVVHAKLSTANKSEVTPEHISKLVKDEMKELSYTLCYIHTRAQFLERHRHIQELKTENAALKSTIRDLHSRLAIIFESTVVWKDYIIKNCTQ